MAGCDVAAKYNSADVHLAPAMKTGRLTVFSDSVVREVTVSKENRATGVVYHHRLTGNPGEIQRPLRRRGLRLYPERRPAAHV